MKKIFTLITVTFFLLLFVHPLVADKIDLVKLKKQEEARKKKGLKSKIILTNDNIKDLTSENTRTSVIQITPDNKTGSAAGEKLPEIKDPNKDREHWAQQKYHLDQAVKNLQEMVNNQQLELNKLQTLHLQMDLPLQKAALKKQIDEVNAELLKNKSLLAKAQTDLEAFYETARKAGIPPGWLR